MLRLLKGGKTDVVEPGFSCLIQTWPDGYVPTDLELWRGTRVNASPEFTLEKLERGMFLLRWGKYARLV